MQLSVFIESYYRPKAMAGLAETTKAGYNSTINKYIIPRFGHYEMEDITAEDIEDWLGTIPKKGAAEKAYKTLRQIIRKARDYDKMHGSDPTTKHIKVPKKKGYQPKLLNAQEVGRLLDGFKGHYLEPTVICAVMLGLRRGEAFALNWEDIDLETGKVRINKTYQNVNLTPSNLGIPDYVVVSGSNGRWDYIKYANGWAECRYLGDSLSRPVTAQSGNIYYHQLVSVTFPFTFIEPPHVTGSLVSSAGNGWVWPQAVTKTGIGGGYIGRGASSTFDAAISWHVVGRWK